LNARPALLALASLPLALVLASPVSAFPLAQARYYGETSIGKGGRIAVGFTPTADRAAFEPSGPRDWQGSHVVASRRLPCVGRDEWSLAGATGTHISGAGFTVLRSARQGQDRLSLRGRFLHSRVRVRVRLRSTRQQGCSYGTTLTARLTRRLKGSCNPRRTTTLARSSTGRVFAERDAADLGGATRNAYGCLFGTRERFFLTEHESPDDYVAAAAIADPLVAVANYRCPADCGGRVDVVDLRLGQPVRFDYIQPMCNQDTGQPPEVSALALAPSGSYAYIAGAYAGARPSINDVVKNVGGENTLLDCGAGIAPRSLTLGGSTLRWSNGGMTHTAPLD
jgi:hypothetical protein